MIDWPGSHENSFLPSFSLASAGALFASLAAFPCVTFASTNPCDNLAEWTSRCNGVYCSVQPGQQVVYQGEIYRCLWVEMKNVGEYKGKVFIGTYYYTNDRVNHDADF